MVVITRKKSGIMVRYSDFHDVTTKRVPCKFKKMSHVEFYRLLVHDVSAAIIAENPPLTVTTSKGIGHVQGIGKSNTRNMIYTASLRLKVFDLGDQKSLEVIAVSHHLDKRRKKMKRCSDNLFFDR